MNCRWLPSRAYKALAVLILLAGVLLAGHEANASWWWPFGYDGLDYKIEINGIDTDLKNDIVQFKLDRKNEDTPPKTIDELRQEGVALGGRLQKLLQSKGYYEAVITQRTIDATADKPALAYDVDTGPRYILQSVTVANKDHDLSDFDRGKLLSKPGAFADADKATTDGAFILTAFGKGACLLRLIVTPVMRLHNDRPVADLVFRVDSGPSADFGPSVVSGNRDVHDSVILNALSWQQGDCYQQSKIETTRNSLIQSQLFSSVGIDVGDAVDENGQVPVSIMVKERAARTVSTGLNYSTDQGVGGTLGWEHRNLFGNAEKFNTLLTLAQQQQSLESKLRIPSFLRKDQSLVLNDTIERRNTDAFLAYTFDNGATVERRLTPTLNAGLGVAFTLTHTVDNLTSEGSDYALLSFPAFIEYNTRDSTLDPKRGVFGRLAATPYTETIGDGGQFLKNQATGQAYYTAEKIPWSPTLAGRLSVGSITGAKGRQVPSGIRYYAGGGGSVRGYDFQSLSPRVNGDPVGGSSLVEAAAEARLHFNGTWGGVAFLDAGNAYESQVPKLNQKLYYGAGAGVRYYSPIGPLRADVAMPLNGKDIGQTGYRIYISIGQAF